MPSSDSTQIFRHRYSPLIVVLLIGVWFFWTADFHWELMVGFAVLLLLSLFHVSLAVVEAVNTGIRYKRFSNWKELGFAEIVDCGVSRVRTEIGYLRLNRFVWPWGKLYFILDEPAKNRVDLLNFIRERVRH